MPDENRETDNELGRGKRAPLPAHAGREAPAIGPSDSSDSGSDLIGTGLASDDASDRHGTGQRASVDEDIDAEPDTDLLPDRVVNADEAGLGGGLDQAEEAQLGTTDEEIEAEMARRLGLD